MTDSYKKSYSKLSSKTSEEATDEALRRKSSSRRRSAKKPSKKVERDIKAPQSFIAPLVKSTEPRRPLEKALVVVSKKGRPVVTCRLLAKAGSSREVVRVASVSEVSAAANEKNIVVVVAFSVGDYSQVEEMVKASFDKWTVVLIASDGTHCTFKESAKKEEKLLSRAEVSNLKIKDSKLFLMDRLSSEDLRLVLPL